MEEDLALVQRIGSKLRESQQRLDRSFQQAHSALEEQAAQHAKTLALNKGSGTGPFAAARPAQQTGSACVRRERQRPTKTGSGSQNQDGQRGARCLAAACQPLASAAALHPFGTVAATQGGKLAALRLEVEEVNASVEELSRQEASLQAALDELERDHQALLNGTTPTA
jgi:hypothetical protein